MPPRFSFAGKGDDNIAVVYSTPVNVHRLSGGK